MGRFFSGLQINFYVSDVERAVAFYTAIGAVESFRTPREGAPLHVGRRDRRPGVGPRRA